VASNAAPASAPASANPVERSNPRVTIVISLFKKTVVDRRLWAPTLHSRRDRRQGCVIGPRSQRCWVEGAADRLYNPLFFG
jgi:hypothetical protein